MFLFLLVHSFRGLRIVAKRIACFWWGSKRGREHAVRSIVQQVRSNKSLVGPKRSHTPFIATTLVVVQRTSTPQGGPPASRPPGNVKGKCPSMHSKVRATYAIPSSENTLQHPAADQRMGIREQISCYLLLAGYFFGLASLHTFVASAPRRPLPVLSCSAHSIVKGRYDGDFLGSLHSCRPSWLCQFSSTGARASYPSHSLYLAPVRSVEYQQGGVLK